MKHEDNRVDNRHPLTFASASGPKQLLVILAAFSQIRDSSQPMLCHTRIAGQRSL